MFKKQTRSYQSVGDEQSPFARVAQVWDDRIGSSRVQARNWRIMAFACMALTVVLTAALIYQAAQTQVESYVVEIDPQGRHQRIELIDRGYTPNAAQVGFHVAELVRKVRSKPTDPVVLKQNWDEAYRFLAGDAVTTMNAYAAKADLFDAAKQDTAVAVEIINVIQRSDGSYQVRWKETTYKHGSQTGVSYWTGLFTTKLMPPKTARAVFHNPLGVYVINFNWSEELTGN
jgi:type IV secretion system protein VirB5